MNKHLLTDKLKSDTAILMREIVESTPDIDLYYITIDGRRMFHLSKTLPTSREDVLNSPSVMWIDRIEVEVIALFTLLIDTDRIVL